jgi:hypothetical protein
MSNRRTLAQARDEFIKAQDEKCSVDEAELQIVSELAEGRRRAVGVPAGGLDYEPIPAAVWLQAIGKGWSSDPTLKGDSVVRVDFQAGSAISKTGHGFVHIRELLDPLSQDDQAAQPQAPSSSTPPPRKNLGGRPGKFDWDRIWIEVVSIAHVSVDGLPERPTVMKRLRDAMTAWGWDDQPSESAMKEKLRRLYRDLPKLPE